MQLLLLVLNKVELLEKLLESFADKGVKGATILNSVGMARELADYPIFGSLRFLIDLDRQESKTIFIVLKDEQVEMVKETVRQVVGDLSKPDTAVMFTLPVLTVEGVEF
ncbi:MAG TPA: hypothetical protein DDZ89_03210 [Clostridiales bacterium]|nr:hypothetical protein [Clostridiales bacterium]